ncbi:uncharacterized protein LOC110386884 isoform X2 [Bombyx mori]|uniref:uncharacterized protein LOC110386884 isoform X2 n=1 Tax=Bombyx mori TaxID=7091 RepID=UPI002ED0D4D5
MGTPDDFEQLPGAQPLQAGLILLKPSRGDLISPAKLPYKDDTNLVYGNTDNLGITYGKTKDRLLHANFRKADLLEKVQRRSRKHHKSSFRDRDSMYSSESSDSSSSSSDFETNPGNPYTIHDDKYEQNWMWKHDMDGEHMNVNPYAPKLHDMNPSGADLFFGRKWWYFNQDDYIPM